MRDILAALQHRVGLYGGHGINHHDEPFYGELDLHVLLDARGVGIRFRATGIDGALLHDERTWVAATPDGGHALWTISTNAGTALCHTLISDTDSEDGGRAVVFRLGDPDDRTILPNQITLELKRDGQVGYHYAWGRPGEPFDDRVSVSMSPLPRVS